MVVTACVCDPRATCPLLVPVHKKAILWKCTTTGCGDAPTLTPPALSSSRIRMLVGSLLRTAGDIMMLGTTICTTNTAYLEMAVVVPWVRRV